MKAIKLYFILTCIVSLSQNGYAQSRDYLVQSSQLPEHLEELITTQTEGWNNITPRESREIGLSTNQKLPNTFFVGSSPFDQFRVTQHGFVVFQPDVIKFLPNEPLNIPARQLPNNTIASFWQGVDLKSKLTPQVFSKVIGEDADQYQLIKWLQFDKKGNNPTVSGVALNLSTHEVISATTIKNLKNAVTGIQISGNEGIQYQNQNGGAQNGLINVVLFQNLFNYLKTGDFDFAEIDNYETKSFFPAWKNWDNCLFKEKHLTLKVTLDLGETYNFGRNEFDASSVTFNVEGLNSWIWNASQTFVKNGLKLTISPDKPEQTLRIELPVEAAAQTKRITLKITDHSIAELVKNNIRIKVELEDNAKVDVRTSPFSQQSLITSIGIKPNIKPVEFWWETACDGIPGYQIQVLRLHNENSSLLYLQDQKNISATVNWTNAFTLFIDHPNKKAKLTLAEGTGYYLFRVRPIGSMYPGGVANPANWGEWSDAPETGEHFMHGDQAATPAAFYYQQFDADKNWTYSRVLSDHAKLAESISYANELLDGIQTQTHLYSPTEQSAEERLMVSQSLIDYNGKAVGQSLTAPVNQTQLKFVEKFATSDEDGQMPYKPSDFDGNGTFYNPNQILGGALQDYWSEENANEKVPSAEGYSFSRTLFKSDGTGRVSEAGSPGKQYIIGSGHTAKFDYNNASEDEIIPYFGDEAVADVQKQISISPDGETSTTLIDAKSGQTIATYLTAGGDHQTKDELASRANSTTTRTKEIIKINEPFNQFRSIPQSFVQTTDVDFHYEITPQKIKSDCLPELDFCQNCAYKVTLQIKKDDPTHEVIFTDTHIITPQPCEDNTSGLTLDFTVQDIPAGSYYISRTLTPLAGDNDGVLTTFRNDVEAYIFNALKNVNDQNLFQLLAEERLEEFYTALGYDYDQLQDGETIYHPVACGTLPIPVLKCAGDVSCEEVSNMNFEEMLFEAYPEFGNQLNKFFRAKGTTVYPEEWNTVLYTSLDISSFVANQTVIYKLYVSTGEGNVYLINNDQGFVYENPISLHQALLEHQNEHGFYWQYHPDDTDIVLLGTPLGGKVEQGNQLHLEGDNLTFDGINLMGYFPSGDFTYPNGNGAFNAMVQNMITDGFNCDRLYQCWSALVDAYGEMAEPEEEVENDQLDQMATKDIDLYSMFLNCTIEYEEPAEPDQPSSNPHLEGFSDDLETVYTQGYKVFYLDQAYAPHATCLDDIKSKYEAYPWTKGHVAWTELKACADANDPNVDINDLQAFLEDLQDDQWDEEELEHLDEDFPAIPQSCLNGNDQECLEDYKVFAESACKMRCEDRALAFELAVKEYHEINNVPFNEEEFCVTSLIDKCKELCHLTIYDPGDGKGMRLGLPEEIQDMMTVWSAVPKILAPEAGGCEADFELTDSETFASDQAVMYLEDKLSDLTSNTTKDYICWNYTSDLLAFYPNLDLANTTSYSDPNPACLPGIKVATNAPYTFTSTTEDTYNAQVEAFINDLNDAIFIHKKTKIYLPLNFQYQVGSSSCLFPRADKSSYIKVTYTEFGFSLHVQLDGVGSENSLLPMCTFESRNGQTFTWSEKDGTIMYGRSAMCLKICPYETCRLVFEQYRDCDNIQEEFITKLNGLVSDGGGVMTVSEFPVGLHFEKNGAIPAATLFPGGIQLKILGDDMPVFNDKIPEILCSVSGDQLVIALRLAGKFLLDEEGQKFWYRPQFGLDEIIEMECLRPACGDDNDKFLVSRFASSICTAVTCPQYCLGWEQPIFEEVPTLKPTTCAMSLSESLNTQLYASVGSLIDSIAAKVEVDIDSACNAPAETYNISYSESTFHYTLFYYDRANNLVKAIAPNGVNATAKTRKDHPAHLFQHVYTYNSFNQVIEERTTDGGHTRYFYDDRGLLRFSQTQQQAQDHKYAYIRYDLLQRPVDAGQALLAGEGISLLEENVNNHEFPGEEWGLHERTITWYSTPYPKIDNILGKQRFTRHRISFAVFDEDGDFKTSKDQYTDVFSYDVHGKIKWIIKDIPELGTKRIRYKHDLVSGNVLEVAFNEGNPDQFFHQYEYDGENRLMKTLTSKDGVIWDLDANQQYYQHGAPERMEIGEDGIQGLDYVYTMRGQVKAINHPNLDKNIDPGNDGNNGMAKDAFGIILNYHEGDFVRAGSQYHNGTNHDLNNFLPAAIKPSTNQRRESFSGLITSSISNVQGLKGQALGYAAKTFNYDEINRLAASNVWNFNGTGWKEAADYATAYQYDPNGNILGLTRNGNSKYSSLKMDNLGYEYYENTNKLKRVSDTVDDNIYTEDLDNQAGTKNYVYNLDGQLIKDEAEGIENIEWNARGKVSKVHKKGNIELEYRYDATGYRTEKIARDNGEIKSREFFVRDAGGNILAVYDRTDQLMGEHKTVSFNLKERNIYAGSRVGIDRSPATWTYENVPVFKHQKIEDVEENQGVLPLGLMIPFNTGAVVDNNDQNDNDVVGPTANIDDLSFDESVVLSDDITYDGEAPVNLTQGMDMDGKTVFKFYTLGNINGHDRPVIEDYTGSPMQNYQGLLVQTSGRSVAVRVPNSPLYYLFTQNNEQLYYHVIDGSVKGNGTTAKPAGRVIAKNKVLTSVGQNTVAMAALEIENEAFIYIKRRFEDKTVVEQFEVTVNGLSFVKQYDLENVEILSIADNMTISSDGRYLAFTESKMGSNRTRIRIIDINQGNDWQQVATLTLPALYIAQALAFSPESKYLYYSSYSGLAGGALSRRDLLNETNEVINGVSVNAGRTSLLLGKDGNLYLASKNRGRLQVINKPNATPSVTTISLAGLSEYPKMSGGLPLLSVKVRKGALAGSAETYARTIGEKYYELSDHLGNVKAVVSDVKLSELSAQNEPENFHAEVVEYNRDYYPFGMQMPDFSGSDENSDYRFGFQGMEKDDDVKGKGKSYYTYYRMLDPRVGRWLSVDPVTRHQLSPYNSFDNNPINLTDIKGDCPLPAGACSQTLHENDRMTNSPDDSRLRADIEQNRKVRGVIGLAGLAAVVNVAALAEGVAFLATAESAGITAGWTLGEVYAAGVFSVDATAVITGIGLRIAEGLSLVLTGEGTSAPKMFEGTGIAVDGVAKGLGVETELHAQDFGRILDFTGVPKIPGPGMHSRRVDSYLADEIGIEMAFFSGMEQVMTYAIVGSEFIEQQQTQYDHMSPATPQLNAVTETSEMSAPVNSNAKPPAANKTANVPANSSSSDDFQYPGLLNHNSSPFEFHNTNEHSFWVDPDTLDNN